MDGNFFSFSINFRLVQSVFEEEKKNREEKEMSTGMVCV